jgi:hypothetical protein
MGVKLLCLITFHWLYRMKIIGVNPKPTTGSDFTDFTSNKKIYESNGLETKFIPVV